ncbi:MAG: hypothetical protein J2P22_14730 [Nocardioides sp.]|nr:hypothetical protein [Nocardioides sp.]
MNPLTRSRRLQAGLAGLSVLSALGAAVGLGLTTHTHGTTQSDTGRNPGRAPRTTSQGDAGHDDSEGGDGGGEDGNSSVRSHRTAPRLPSTPVAPPTSSAPQATTSGS